MVIKVLLDTWVHVGVTGVTVRVLCPWKFREETLSFGHVTPCCQWVYLQSRLVVGM